MSLNQTREIPRDKNGNALQGVTPSYKALQVFAEENATVSSVVTLNANTTHIEFAAINSAAVARWVPTTDTQASVISAEGTANYDVIIPSGVVRKLIPPIETIGTSSIVGLNIQGGLYRRLAYKSVGVGSVLTAEY